MYKIIYLEPGEVFELDDGNNTKLIYVGEDLVCADCYYWKHDIQCYSGINKPNKSLYCKDGCCFKEIKSGL